MKVKALDNLEDANQHPEPDGNGGYTLITTITAMKAGSEYEIADDHAQRLIGLGLVSADLSAPLLPHLLPPPVAAQAEQADMVVATVQALVADEPSA